MNLCILPRPTGIIYEPFFDNTNISTSVFDALTQMELKLHNEEVIEIYKMINPHEYVFSKISDTSSISKINATSNLYYELYEILNTFDILKTLYLTIFHIGNDVIVSSPFHLLFNNTISNIHQCVIGDNIEPADFIFMDIGINLDSSINIIVKSLNVDGIAIIKLSNIYTKKSVAILYLLSILFNKTYIVKPSVINILASDIFILCIGRLSKTVEYDEFRIPYMSIPAIFSCKIEEFNSVNGYRQLDSYDQLFNLLSNKNKVVKLELLKKTNIQKSVAWCERHNIPHHKMGDKVNMFLRS